MQIDGATLDPGTTVGGYEVIEQIGQGGMGAVYKARQLSVDRIVALKILPPRLAGDEDYVARFLREARTAAKLAHPHIVQIFDAGEADGYHHFAMEFVDGPSVDELIRQGDPLPERRAFEIVRDIARALDHADARAHLIHRDVKPANILITSEGAAKLADLGLARETADTDVRLTRSGMLVGTPNYISPEQARGERELDIRTDIYSLGATLYHMLVGAPPYTGGSASEVIAKHLRDPVPDARAANPDVSPGAAAIIRRAMAKDPAARYPDARALLADLEKLLGSPRADMAAVPGGLGATATWSPGAEAELAPRCRGFHRRAAVAVVAAALGMVLVVVLWPRPRDEAPPPEAQHRGADTGAPSPAAPREDATAPKHAAGSLHDAAREGLLDQVKALVAGGADVNEQNAHGITALELAAQQGHSEVLRFLLNNGADARLRNRYGHGPLFHAVCRGDRPAAELLLARGADVRAVDTDGQTLLHRAGSPTVAEFLLGKGLDLAAADKDGRTPLHTAAQFGRKDVVALLLEKGGDVNTPSRHGRTPLHWAAIGGDGAVAEFLLSKGAKVNARNKLGKTPLAEARKKEVRALLQERGGQE